VVSPPEPQVVADDVGAVDLQRLRGLADGGSADAGEDVGQDRRVGRVAGARAGPIWTRTELLVVPASKMNPPMRMPLTSAVCRIVSPPFDTSVARPMPSTTVSGLLTSIVPLTW
jgi:hypothetical protein